LQKNDLIREEDSIFVKYFYRKISIPISFFIIKHNLPISPNMMTFISLIFGVFTGIFFFIEENILGGIFLQFWVISDCCNGELAKIRKSSPKLGKIFDRLSDRISEISLFLGIGLNKYVRTTFPSISIISLIFSFYFILRHYTYELFLSYDKSVYVRVVKYSNDFRIISSIYGFFRFLRSGVFTILITLFSFFNQQFIALLFYFVYLLSNDAFFALKLLFIKKK
jgi:phosphatidylglycerophosphate synthase